MLQTLAYHYQGREVASMNTCAKLTQILNDCKITPKQDAQFLYEFQQSVLLAIKESGALTESQFRYAAGKLKEQYLSAIKGQTI